GDVSPDRDQRPIGIDGEIEEANALPDRHGAAPLADERVDAGHGCRRRGHRRAPLEKEPPDREHHEAKTAHRDLLRRERVTEPPPSAWDLGPSRVLGLAGTTRVRWAGNGHADSRRRGRSKGCELRPVPGGRSGKNRSLPRSDHAGERDRREGMFRQEGLYPVYAQKTAKALGLTISQSPLVRADQVIQ